MKEIVIISGKGGTGKTTLTAALASLWDNITIADCDVDAADLHLLLKPEIMEENDFYAGVIPFINPDKCTECGKCIEVCQFEAIDNNYKINKVNCEGCAVCKHFCPDNAISLDDRLCGKWYISGTRFGPLVHAKLGIAEENSGKLVTLLKKKAKELAEKKNHHFVLIDGSPGIGCPVISSIGGAALVIIVVEPTISGIHDMDRVIKLISHFKLPGGIVINKSNLNIEMSKRIETIAKQNNLNLFGKISYNSLVTKAMVEGKTVIEYSNNSVAKEIKDIYHRINTVVSSC